MFTIKSFDQLGNVLTNVTQQPAFYGLLVNGRLIEYYTTLDAVHNAAKLAKIMIQSQELTNVERIAA